VVAIVLGALIGYLLGAIPFGLLVGRITRGIDIREYGSHRTGATNALRTLGAGPAALVFILDVSKGLAAVLIARFLLPADSTTFHEWAAAAAGIGAIVGHNWSIYIRFTGGRGVATSTGALGGMAPWAILVMAPLVFFIIWRWRYVSLGSVSGALVSPVVVGILALIGLSNLQALTYAVVAGFLVTTSHADNIARLRAGTERKIGQKEQVATHG
jgi:acyl phosphate:glycerol-3-phosphate acyltransferase